MDNILKIKSKLKNFFFPHKDYFLSLLPYLLVSFLIFLIGIISGYYLAKAYPAESQKLISLLEKTYGPILETSKISQIFYIFLKNGITAFAVIIFGAIFGILPAISLFSNGEVLGVLAISVLGKFNALSFLAGTLPHGLIEVPCLLISSAIGLKIGKTSIKKILGKGGSIKEEVNAGLNFFLRVILILLFLAAIIEVLISSEALRAF